MFQNAWPEHSLVLSYVLLTLHPSRTQACQFILVTILIDGTIMYSHFRNLLLGLPYEVTPNA